MLPDAQEQKTFLPNNSTIVKYTLHFEVQVLNRDTALIPTGRKFCMMQIWTYSTARAIFVSVKKTSQHSLVSQYNRCKMSEHSKHQRSLTFPLYFQP